MENQVASLLFSLQIEFSSHKNFLLTYQDPHPSSPGLTKITSHYGGKQGHLGLDLSSASHDPGPLNKFLSREHTLMSLSLSSHQPICLLNSQLTFYTQLKCHFFLSVFTHTCSLPAPGCEPSFKWKLRHLVVELPRVWKGVQTLEYEMTLIFTGY